MEESSDMSKRIYPKISSYQDEESAPAFKGNPRSKQSCCGGFLVGLAYFIILLTFPLTLCFCFKIVKEYERAVIFRLGRLGNKKAKGPGVFFVNFLIDKYIKVDLRTVTYDVPPQEILTKDSVT
ncbi:hypothetical protein SNEBB_004096, partial [Seison nebaliae]